MLKIYYSCLSILWFLGFGLIKVQSPNTYQYKIVVKEIYKPYSSNRDTIYHSSDYKLTWNDFTATPNGTLPFVAMTNSGFGYQWSSVSDDSSTTITIYTSVYFIKSKSWVKQEAKTAYELAHEQLHFDITRQIANGFIKELNNLKVDGNFTQTIRQLYKRHYNKLLIAQNQYDEQTNHGLRKPEQLIWNEKVKKDLELIKF
ncbi:DUF922 domain-containing protein [Solitalea lacus]|uniref:DUF922 domain-containing protein n=1 Tax=Solitalea lacus TaxID=2911172 RepID=UPI001EDB8CBD|nr:DUF922 domain-containing protein [Solitalea lacus]UKJ08896.1 DUF922 domain-containing Zn-dependent protease [Solitalea lacus]